MRPHFATLIGGVLSLLGCADPYAPIRTTAGNLSQEQVDQILKDCGAPVGMASIEGQELVINPSKDIMITGCVLKALQETGETKLPSVGNQRFEVPEKQ